MEPIKFDEATPEFLEGRLLLLNTSIVGPRRMRQLQITRGSGVKQLPQEIWDMIFESAASASKAQFCFVKASLVSTSAAGRVLRCVRHEIETGSEMKGRVAGRMQKPGQVHAFHKFMDSTAESTADELGISLRRLAGPDNTFDVLVQPPAGSDGHRRKDRLACLYSHFTVPDVISRVDDGWCGFCDRDRFISLGHRYLRWRSEDFDVFMGCGVCQACPLCMGLEFSSDHKDFLQFYYWKEVPEEEEAQMRGCLRERLEELGYDSAVAEWI